MKNRVVDIKKFAPAAGLIILAIAVLELWSAIALGYDYHDLSGTYVFRGNGETCTLSLRPDGTFTQEVTLSGESQRSQGHWRRYGEAHVSFSSEFVTLPGEKLNESGQAHGEFSKTVGVFPRLVLAPLPNGPTLRRQLLP